MEQSKGDTHQLELARWILERHLHWIAAAEAKTAVLVALDTGMLGALAAGLSGLPSSERTAGVVTICVVAASLLGWAIFCAAMVVVPRTKGPTESLIYFGTIADRQASAFLDEYRRSTTLDFLHDCVRQVHRNAEIASDKFMWVRRGMFWSFVAIVPWLIAVGATFHR